MCTAIREMMEESKSEGRMEGNEEKLVAIVQKKLERGDSVEKIADDLVEDLSVVQQIVKELQQSGKGR